MKDDTLKYKFLSNFDRTMNILEDKYKWLSDYPVSYYYLFMSILVYLLRYLKL